MVESQFNEYKHTHAESKSEPIAQILKDYSMAHSRKAYAFSVCAYHA